MHKNKSIKLEVDDDNLKFIRDEVKESNEILSKLIRDQIKPKKG